MATQSTQTSAKQPATENAESREETRQRRSTLAKNEGPRSSPLARYPELRSPFGVVSRFMDDMDRMFDTFTGQSTTSSMMGPVATETWHPQIETFERDGKIIVRADLPGIPEDSVSVKVDHDVLTISGVRHDDRTEQREGYYHSERTYGSFQRSIKLPPFVDHDEIKASFDDGVLEVSVPIPSNARSKRIDIGRKATQPEPTLPKADKN